MQKHNFIAVAAVIALVLSSLALIHSPAAQAAPPANEAFQRTWQRTDKPVADQQVVRTWMWGPEGFTGPKTEDYVESPGGTRQVQYFDKSRMEITHPSGDPNSIWYVTNGLLVRELVTGLMQVGDSAAASLNPAQVNVAGDPDDANGPTYATFDHLQAIDPHPDGTTITTTLNRAGSIGVDASKASYGVTAGTLASETNHRVASVFWSFMTSAGTVYQDGAFVNAPLFENPYYATGYPISEAYWATVKVGNQPRDVLMQCFERRCLTYTPANPAEWQVEMGNVGQHYYAWRYGADQATPTATATSTATATASPTPEPMTFADGHWEVGKDIKPGTYRARYAAANTCRWKRLDSMAWDDYFDEPEFGTWIASGYPDGPDLVTILPTDVGFYSENCGTWTTDLSPIAGALMDVISAGTYLVNVDIAPGTYHSIAASDDCYWYRLRGFTGQYEDTIASESIGGGQTVTIYEGDVGFDSTEGCGGWIRSNDSIRASPRDLLTNGIWRVGIDVAPGIWANQLMTDGCSWARISNFSGDMSDEIIEYGYESDWDIQIVTIYPSDTGFRADDDCGLWVYLGT